MSRSRHADPGERASHGPAVSELMVFVAWLGEDLTGQLAMDLAAAAAAVLRDAGAFAGPRRQPAGGPWPWSGRDPRASGEFLEAAVVAGLAGSGVDVLRLGVIPTPAVAFLTRDLGADLGVMLSASHNPAPDNGIKLFARGGFKLPDAVEDEIEARLIGRPGPAGAGPPAGGLRPGQRRRGRAGALPRPPARLAARGSAARRPGTAGGADGRGGLRARRRLRVAPRVLQRAGAEVIAIGAEPDGVNINEGCGSTHLDTLSAAVAQARRGRRHRARRGRRPVPGGRARTAQVIDGDQILAVLALALADAGPAGRATRWSPRSCPTSASGWPCVTPG